MANVVPGDRVKDRLTGFEGIVTSITEYLYGCRRIAVQPTKLKDGKTIEPEVFDEPALDILEARAFTPVSQARGPRVTGGPRPVPAPRSVPSR